jgi:hypothetical protein
MKPVEKIAETILKASQNDIHAERIKIMNFIDALSEVSRTLKTIENILSEKQLGFDSDIVISSFEDTSFGKKLVVKIPIEVQKEVQKDVILQQIHPLPGVEVVKGKGKDGYIIRVQTLDHYL